jgi:hypothetical protein
MFARAYPFTALLLLLGCSDPAGVALHNGADAAVETAVASGGASGHGSGGLASSTGGHRQGAGGIIASGGVSASGGAETGGAAESDAGADAVLPDGSDAASDAARADSHAAGGSAAIDAGDSDAGNTPDAAPCECSSGPCCDGCRFRSTATKCGTELTSSVCDYHTAGQCSFPPSLPSLIVEDWSDIFCSGASASCDGKRVYSETRTRTCPWNTFCSGTLTPSSTPQPCGPC